MDIPPKISWNETTSEGRVWNYPSCYPTKARAKLMVKRDVDRPLRIRISNNSSLDVSLDRAEQFAMQILQVCEAVREGLNELT